MSPKNRGMASSTRLTTATMWRSPVSFQYSGLSENATNANPRIAAAAEVKYSKKLSQSL